LVCLAAAAAAAAPHGLTPTPPATSPSKASGSGRALPAPPPDPTSSDLIARDLAGMARAHPLACSSPLPAHLAAAQGMEVRSRPRTGLAVSRQVQRTGGRWLFSSASVQNGPEPRNPPSFFHLIPAIFRGPAACRLQNIQTDKRASRCRAAPQANVRNSDTDAVVLLALLFSRRHRFAGFAILSMSQIPLIHHGVTTDEPGKWKVGKSAVTLIHGSHLAVGWVVLDLHTCLPAWEKR